MLTIRFARFGKKNQSFYKIIVTSKENAPGGGRFLEVLGSYNPFTKEKTVNAERVKYWISVGAEVSDSVYNFLVSEKIVEGKKIPVHKKAKKKEKKPEEAEKTEEKKEETAETKQEDKPLTEEKPKQDKKIKEKQETVQDKPEKEPEKDEPVKAKPEAGVDKAL